MNPLIPVLWALSMAQTVKRLSRSIKRDASADLGSSCRRPLVLSAVGMPESTKLRACFDFRIEGYPGIGPALRSLSGTAVGLLMTNQKRLVAF